MPASVCLTFERRIPPNVPTVDLTGPWSARPGDGDLAKEFADPAFDEQGWTTVELPHHWRTVDEFAAEDGPFLYRRYVHGPAARDGPAVASSSTTASSTTATRGSTATTSARPRATSSRTRSKSPMHWPRSVRPRGRARGRLPAATRSHRETDDHRRCSGTGTRPIRRSTPVDRGDRCASPRPAGAHRQPAGAVHRSDRGTRPAHVQHHARRRRRPARRGAARPRRRRRRPDAARCLPRGHARDRREPAVVDADRRGRTAVVAAVTRRATALHVGAVGLGRRRHK